METQFLHLLLKEMRKDIHDIQADIKILLEEKHKHMGAKHAITAAVSAFMAIGTSLLTFYFKH